MTVIMRPNTCVCTPCSAGGGRLICATGPVVPLCVLVIHLLLRSSNVTRHRCSCTIYSIVVSNFTVSFLNHPPK